MPITGEKYTKKSCLLNGTEYCGLLNMPSCEKCTVDCRTEEKAQRIKSDLDDIRNMLPKGTTAGLFAGRECVLCKGEEKGKKTWYAFCDLGSAAPRKNRAKGLLGLVKGEPRFSTLLPIQLGCCEKCKKNITRISYAKPIAIAVATVVPLIILLPRPVHEPLMAITHGLPFYIFAACVAAGVIFGELIKRGMIKKYAAETYINIMKAPKLKEFAKLGWFELFKEKGLSRLVFSKKPAESGLFMNAPEYAPQNTAKTPENAEKSGETD